MNTLQHYAQSDIGKQRAHNEDTFIDIATPDGKHALIGAIDGMGGYAGGEIAAKLYRDSLAKSFTLCAEGQGFSPTTADNIEDLRQWVIAGNNHIVTESTAQPKYNMMACVATIALIDVQAEQIYYAHVGDTRGYIFRRGELIKLTHDHSPVGRLEDEGALLETDAMRHPRRNEVERNLGQKPLSPSDTHYVEVGSHSFYAGDLVLLCSDGLTDLVDRATLISILAQQLPLRTLAQQLIDRANALGGKDNITIALATLETDVQVLPESSLVIEEVAMTGAPAHPSKGKQTKPLRKKNSKTNEKLTDFYGVLPFVLMAACLVAGLLLGTLYGHRLLDWLSPTPPTIQQETMVPDNPLLTDDTIQLATDDLAVSDSVLISTTEKAEYDSLKDAHQHQLH